MGSVLIVVGAFVGYVVAYKTYGRFLSRKLFGLDNERKTAAVECEDGIDFVPTKAQILFGHHYTSIAGTGPIVGPAIGIIWGWVPALLWVVFGSIFMGAVHDFGAVVVSMRNKGRSIGDVAAELISPRVRMMFLSLVAVAIMMVIAIFCLVIAKVFILYPESVIPIWLQLPIAVALGHAVYKKKMPAMQSAIVAVILMYLTVALGAIVKAQGITVAIPQIGPISPVVSWSIILLIYGYIASVLPVWRLLQPRDYINGYQLFIAMGMLALGVLFAHPTIVAPAWNPTPEGAPPFWALFFVTIACGAISGFHSLVASGTTSKQLCRETDAQAIGYGSMLLEGMLAVFVIVAVAGGIGMAMGDGAPSGVEAWNARYVDWASAKGLGAKLDAFVQGSSNMLTAFGMPMTYALAIMSVFVASFAATTLDTSMRIQRYVITELATVAKLKPIATRHGATLVATLTAAALALWDGKGAGGLILWPLFGATNQLIACLALMVVTTYLKKNGKPIIYTLLPAIIMFVIAGVALTYKAVDFAAAGLPQLHLLVISVIVAGLEIWMVVETIKVLLSAKNKDAEAA